MKIKVIVASVALLFLATTVIIYAHQRGNTSVPEIEVNELYALADKNGDGSISKEEFAAYLEVRKSFAGQASSNSNVRICPESGLPCTGSCGDSCSSGEGGGCCGHQSASSAAPFAASGARKTAFERQTTGGCGGGGSCGGEMKEGGCCGGGGM